MKTQNLKKQFLGSALISATLVAGCAQKQKSMSLDLSQTKEVVSADYSSFKSGSVQMPPIKVIQLKNKLKVYFLKDDKLPRISINLLMASGVRGEKIQGLNFVTASLLDQGTKKHSALVIADLLGDLGTEMSISPGSDFITMSADALSTDKEDLLKLYSEILMEPVFSQIELNRLKSQVIAMLKKAQDNPGQFASQEFESWLYQGHPYGIDEKGTIESIQKITVKDVKEHYQTWFRPQMSSLAIAGKFDEEFERKVISRFEKWQMNSAQLPSPTKLGENTKVEVKFLEKQGLNQAEIRMGQIAVPRGDSDFLIMRLANEALGGSFASRLNQVIRDDQGLTYSIYSFMDGRRDAGSFQISTFTKNKTLGKTVDETLKVFKNFASKGITESELEAAKNQLAGQFPRAIETSDRLAFNVLVLDFYGVPFSYLTTFNKTVREIKLNQVNDVIKKKWNPEAMKVLVFADPSTKDQLQDIR